MDFKFDTRVPGDNPDVTLKYFPKRGRGQGHVTPLNFWAVNANSSKTVKHPKLFTKRGVFKN